LSLVVHQAARWVVVGLAVLEQAQDYL